MKEIDFQHDLLPLKNLLYRLALRISLDTAEAEDIVEETLLRVWHRRAELTEIDSLEAYCQTICRNLALDAAAKAAARNVPIDEATEQHAEAESAPDEAMAHREKIALVGRLIDSLPVAQRTAVQLRDIEGKTYREIAGIMGLTEANVKVTLFRARQRIKKDYQSIENYGL